MLLSYVLAKIDQLGDKNLHMVKMPFDNVSDDMYNEMIILKIFKYYSILYYFYLSL